MDSSTYVPDQSSMLVFTDPSANVNDQPVNFGPLLYDVMKQISDDVGGMAYVVGELQVHLSSIFAIQLVCSL
jgi:hypothetical protein